MPVEVKLNTAKYGRKASKKKRRIVLIVKLTIWSRRSSSRPTQSQ